MRALPIGTPIMTEYLKEFYRSLDFADIEEFYCESWVMPKGVNSK